MFLQPGGRTLNTRAKLIAAALLAGLIALPTHTQAQSAAAHASVQVVAPLSVESAAELEFGMLRGGRSAGEVEVNASGSVASRGGVELLDGPQPHPARFEVSGEPNRSYIVSMPQTVVVAPQGAAGDSTARRPVELTLVSSGGGQNGASSRLDASGADTIFVGGRITIAARMPAGRYAVELPVTVAYN